MFIDAENRIENCSEKLSEEELENLFLRINKFIVRNKITRREFMENHKIYLTFGDFKELFKKIRFEISSAELNHFFNFNNDMAIEGYILGRQFLLNFKNNIKFFDQSSSDGEDIILISDDKSSSICEMTEENFEKIKLTSYKNNSKIDNKNSENLSKVKVEMEIFNKELKLLKDEIFQIVKKNENSDIPSNIQFKIF